MATKKHLIPFNGTGSATEGLMVILNAGGQAQGYVWEHTYPGGGAALPGKEIPRYVLGENDLRVFIQTPGWLHREAGSLKTNWTGFQNSTEAWVNYYGNDTVNLSLDGKSPQAVAKLVRRYYGFEANDPPPHASKPTGTSKNLIPFNGGPQKITSLMVMPEHQAVPVRAYFWEQPIGTGGAGPSRSIPMRTYSPSHAGKTRVTLLVGLGDSPESALLYRNASTIDVDLAEGSGSDIWVNFYSSNMTVNISLDGKGVHAVSTLVPF